MEMFQYDFIIRALIAGVAISFITPILGLLLILRRQSLLADTLSHISLVGVALGMIYQVRPTYMTILVVIIASILIEYLRVAYKDYSEISVAIMMAAGMSIALVLTSLNPNATNFKIDQFLFGSLILISQQEVNLIVILALVVVLLYCIFRKPLYIMSFDEATAVTTGLPVKWMSIIFSALTGVAISIMMPIVGSLLVSALIVIPSATAIRISKSFTQTLVIALCINLVGIFMGLVASYHLNTPPGASISLGFIVIFILVVGIQALRTRRHRRQA